MCVWLHEPVHHALLWLNSPSPRFLLVLMCVCVFVCECIHAINYNIVCVLDIKKYDAFVQITAIWTFYINKLIAVSSRDIEWCYLASIYLALSWKDSIWLHLILVQLFSHLWYSMCDYMNHVDCIFILYSTLCNEYFLPPACNPISPSLN